MPTINPDHTPTAEEVYAAVAAQEAAAAAQEAAVAAVATADAALDAAQKAYDECLTAHEPLAQAFAQRLTALWPLLQQRPFTGPEGTQQVCAAPVTHLCAFHWTDLDRATGEVELGWFPPGPTPKHHLRVPLAWFTEPLETALAQLAADAKVKAEQQEAERLAAERAELRRLLEKHGLPLDYVLQHGWTAPGEGP